jgi:hypothetical protein
MRHTRIQVEPSSHDLYPHDVTAVGLPVDACGEGKRIGSCTALFDHSIELVADLVEPAATQNLVR